MTEQTRNVEAELKSLKNSRAQVKGELTRFETFLKNFDIKVHSINLLNVRINSITPILDKFTHYQSQIETLYINSLPNDYDANESETQREEFENRYYNAIASAHKAISDLAPAPSHNTTVATADTASASVTAKLPVLKLPEFSGSYSDWQRFHDTFSSLVHNNGTLTNIDKFYYLQASLKDEAADIIASLSISDGNYITAWDLLKNRYKNKKVIINAHLKEIIELQGVTKESHTNLRNLSNTFQKNYRSLKSLGEDVEKWDTILIYLLVTKLDLNSRRDWEIFSKTIDSPKISDFDTFLTQRCETLESLDPNNLSITNNKKPNNLPSRQHHKSFLTTDKSQHITKCPICKSAHNIYICNVFKGMSVESRFDEVKKANLCTNCLRYGHRAAECRSGGCKICNQRHATLLHLSRNSNNKIISNKSQSFDSQMASQTLVSNSLEQTVSAPSTSQTHHAVLTANTNDSTSNDKCVLLSTAIINILDEGKNPVQCRILLDNGSQSNFLTKSCVERLKLNTKQVNIPIAGINQIKNNISERVEVNIRSMHTGYKAKINCLVLPTITDLLPQNHFESSLLNIPAELSLADPSFNIPSEIDGLLGCQLFFDLLCVRQIKLGKNLPVLQKTLLGWLVTGNLPLNQNTIKTDVMVSNCFFSQELLHNAIEKFWSIEEVNHPHARYTKEESECEEHFVKNTTRDDTGRFTVKLPLKENFFNLGESETTALNRLYAIERRLAKLPEIESAYRSFLKEYEYLGHMSEVPDDFIPKTPICYLPHHFVQNTNSPSTKVRCVFDASCKTTTNISLNNALKVGPTIQEDLFSILLRFRKHSIVIIGDLTKMYRQILVEKSHRDLQRILYRSNPNEKVKHYQLNTVTYGTAPASFLATRCLKQIALDNKETFPLESKIIESDFYVDDLLTGFDDKEQAIRSRKIISQILSEYGFELRKLQSNDTEIINDISLENATHNQYLITDDSSVKTLGIAWSPSADQFIYNSNIFSQNDKISKRTILSFIAKIFDPLGLLGPLTIRAKLIVQKLWQLEIGWDQSIPSQLYTEWIEIKNEISQVGQIKIPRHVLTPRSGNIHLHAFADASESAYACCIYLRSADDFGNISSELLCAKSKVAPLKVVSLPRLELCGALLLARLLKKCLDALRLDIEKFYLWTDSTITLGWIANEPRTWKTFIANRVAEIQNLTNINDWNYISSENNPADIISRGTRLSALNDSNLWWHGPAFLSSSSYKFPTGSHISNFSSSRNIPEMKVKSFTIINTDIDIFKRFSSLRTLINVFCYCLRFIRRETHDTTRLSLNEIERATTQLLKLTQSQSFSEDIKMLEKHKIVSKKSKLKSLDPFLDKDNLIRVGGRLKNSHLLSFDVKHQIILPAKHPFTQLVIDYEHKRTLHAGTQNTLSHVRQKYWPLNAKQIIKSHIRKCINCFRARPTSVETKMGDLPQLRITPSRPFQRVFVDFCGPFDLKDGKLRNNKIIKGYICLFVCIVTKAVHIEVVSDLTSDGFLSMLKRLVSRRGLCSDIFSDNATNFVGSKNELLSIVNEFGHSNNVKTYLESYKITWHFIPAKSPNFGGLWEAAVKSCKHHLKRVLNGTPLTYEEFYTITTQVEAILNSRPLTPMSTDPNDLDALTPAHFIIGSPLTALPERDWTECKINYVKRYRHLQLIGQHFWSRWNKEYLHLLQQRTKWLIKSENLPIGSLVLLKEENLPSMRWKFGRIVKVHAGPDNIARVFSVKTSSGIFKRAISKICPLPYKE